MEPRVDIRQRTVVREATPPELPIVSESPSAEPDVELDRPIPVPTLLTALMTWSFGVFMLCYGAIPWALALIGMRLAPLEQLGSEMVGVGSAVALVALVTAIFRPTVRVRDVRKARIIGATAAALGTWLVLSQVLPGLVRLSDMGAVQLPVWVAWNTLEAALWGAMLASVARTAFKAFALAAAFEVVLMVVTCMGFAITSFFGP